MSMSMSMSMVMSMNQDPNLSTIVPSSPSTALLSPTNPVLDTNFTNAPEATSSPTSVVDGRVDSNPTITSEPTSSPSNSSATNGFDPRTPPIGKEEPSSCHENGDDHSEQDALTIEALITLNNTDVSVETVTQAFNDAVDTALDCTTRRNLASASKGTCQQQSCPGSCATFLCTREESVGLTFAGCAQVEIALGESLPSGTNVTVSCAESDGDPKVATATIAGWIIGGLAVVGLLCVCVYCRYKNKIEYDSGLLYSKIEDDEDPQPNDAPLLGGVEDSGVLVSVNEAAQFDAGSVDGIPFVGDVVAPKSDRSLL